LACFGRGEDFGELVDDEKLPRPAAPGTVVGMACGRRSALAAQRKSGPLVTEE